MSPSTRTTSMASIMVIIIVVAFFGACVSASTSVIAWNGPTSSGEPYSLEGLSDLMLARASSESRVLAKARQIIKESSLSSTCSYAPTARLLQQCKNIKPKHDNPLADYQLGNAESAYAILMALCEAQQAQIVTPSACQIFERMLDRVLPDASIEIIRPQDIESCSAALYGTSSWTSYSVYKSNSKFLCDSSRTDYQREELMETLRDATNVIPEILDALTDHRSEAQHAMSQLRSTAADIDMAHREVLLHAQAQGEVQSIQLKQILQYIEALKDTMAETFSENTKILDLSTQRAGQVDQKLTEAYASFIEMASGLTFDFDEQIHSLSNQVTSIVGEISDLANQGILEDVRTSMYFVSQAASELVEAQAAQLAKSQQVLQSFHDFSPEQLLPRWLKQLTTFTSGWIVQLKFEATFFAIFAAPGFGFSIFGHHRSTLCMALGYLTIRSLDFHVDRKIIHNTLASVIASTTVNEIAYLMTFAVPAAGLWISNLHTQSICVISAYFFSQTMSNILLTQVPGYLTSLSPDGWRAVVISAVLVFITSTCVLVGLNRQHLDVCRPKPVVEIAREKSMRRNLKEKFERSRRACSVPIDCESA